MKLLRIVHCAQQLSLFTGVNYCDKNRLLSKDFLIGRNVVYYIAYQAIFSKKKKIEISENIIPGSAKIP